MERNRIARLTAETNDIVSRLTQDTYPGAKGPLPAHGIPGVWEPSHTKNPQAPQHQPQQAPSWLGPLPTPKPVPGGGVFTHQANPMDAASRPRQPSNPQSQQQTAPVLPPGELPAWTGALLNTKS